MYRLVLYFLVSLLIWAGILSLFRLLPFTLPALLFQISILLIVSLAANFAFSKVYKVVPNYESVYITSLILSLIITPSSPANIPFLFWAAVLSQSSKYILSFSQKHLFNPAAAAVFLTSAVLGFSASWWVGTKWMLPLVLVGGFLVIQKIRRWGMVLPYVVGYSLFSIIYTSLRGFSAISFLPRFFLETPVAFFASIMLTEPLTAPAIQKWRFAYGLLIGLLMVFLSPEVSLLIGNIFSFIVNPDSRRTLVLKEKNMLSPNIYDYVFYPNRPLSYSPGQYLEWTLASPKIDARGNRRYFTLASSPTEPNLHLGVKFYPRSSSFKNSLLQMQAGDSISVASLSGDFVLPADKRKKLVFIAGGIGVTPFRSMAKYLADRNEARDIKMFYQANLEEEFVYQDIFAAAKNIGMETIYISSRLSKETLQSYLGELLGYYYYLSGPEAQVEAYKKLLLNNSVPRSHIKTDYFPGF